MTREEELEALVRAQMADRKQDHNGLRETMAAETFRRANPKGESLAWILSDDEQPILEDQWQDPRTPTHGSQDG